MEPTTRVLVMAGATEEALALCAGLQAGSAGACLCRRAADLAAARAALAAEPFFDAVLLDLDWPDAPAPAAQRALGRLLEPCALLTLSADSDDRRADEALAGGAQDHLPRTGLTGDALWRTLRRAVARHRVHRAQRAQVEALHAVLETIPEAVLGVSADGAVRLCNGSARALLDFAASPEALAGPLRRVAPRAARGEAHDDLLVPCPGPRPGHLRHFVATLRPLRFSETEAGGLIVLRDETQHHESDERIRDLNADLARSLDERTGALRVAEEANRLKLKFLEAVSHELRTPLTPILGFSRLLLRRPTQALAPDDQETLELISENAQRLLRVVDSMLDFQALQRQAQTPDVAPTALPSLLAGIAHATRERLAGAPVHVIVDSDPDVPEILLCDGRRLEQILQRLMHNAATYTPHGEIRLRIAWRDGRLKISVRDTGVGISPEHQARIFYAFYQVDPGVGPSHGVGLGLPYAQVLAQSMGGSIQVQSQLGRGSEFTVELPAPRVDDEPDDLDREEAPAAPELGGASSATAEFAADPEADPDFDPDTDPEDSIP